MIERVLTQYNSPITSHGQKRKNTLKRGDIFIYIIYLYISHTMSMPHKTFSPQDVACPHCASHSVQKNGVLQSGWQRFICADCERHFTLNGIRNTYSDLFREQIADFYINRKISARKLSRKYQLSTSTIVQRWKFYKQQRNGNKEWM